MSRKFGKVLCTAWNDPQWLALSDAAMVLYVSMISQHDISPAGVLPLTERRWKGYLDGGLNAVSEALDELTDTGFVLVDEDTAEVLVRTFIKHDGRLQNANLGASVHRAVGQIHSERLRNVAERAISDITAGGRALDTRRKGPSTPVAEAIDDSGVLVPTYSVGEEPRTKNHEPRNPSVVVDNPTGDEPEPDRPTDDRFNEVIDIATRAVSDKYPAKVNPDRHRQTIRQDIADKHTATITELLRRQPNSSPTAIARQIEENHG